MTESTHFGLASQGGRHLSPRRLSPTLENRESERRVETVPDPVQCADLGDTHAGGLTKPDRRGAGELLEHEDREEETEVQVQLSFSQLFAAATSRVFDDKIQGFDDREQTFSDAISSGTESPASALTGTCGPGVQPLLTAGLPDAVSSPSGASFEKLREVISLIASLGSGGDAKAAGQQIGIRLNGNLFASTTLTISSQERGMQVHCRSSSASETEWFSRHASMISSQLEARLKRRVRFVVLRDEN